MTKFKLDAKAGLYSSTKALLDKDKAMVKRVQKGVQLRRPNAVQSALIRRHFLELTQTFMIPLERYLASLMPLARNISPYRAAPKVKPFNQAEFLTSLDNCGPQLTSNVKGDWEGLYRRFFKSPNFVSWYNLRHREVAQKLQLLHLESLAESRIEVCLKIQSWFIRIKEKFAYDLGKLINLDMSKIEYLLLFFCRRRGKNQNKYSKFNIQCNQIDDMTRPLVFCFIYF